MEPNERFVFLLLMSFYIVQTATTTTSATPTTYSGSTVTTTTVFVTTATTITTTEAITTISTTFTTTTTTTANTSITTTTTTSITTTSTTTTTTSKTTPSTNSITPTLTSSIVTATSLKDITITWTTHFTTIETIITTTNNSSNSTTDTSTTSFTTVTTTPLDKCKEYKGCLNGGNCIYNSTNDLLTCECLDGYTGQDCAKEILRCQTSLCGNTGLCEYKFNSHSCNCFEGFDSFNASTCFDKNECLNSTCVNATICDNRVGSYMCLCNKNYYGKNCDIYNADPNITQSIAQGNLTDFRGVLAGGSIIRLRGQNFGLIPPVEVTFISVDNSSIRLYGLIVDPNSRSMVTTMAPTTTLGTTTLETTTYTITTVNTASTTTKATPKKIQKREANQPNDQTTTASTTAITTITSTALTTITSTALTTITSTAVTTTAANQLETIKIETPTAPNNDESLNGTRYKINILFSNNQSVTLPQEFVFAPNPTVTSIEPKNPFISDTGSASLLIRGQGFESVEGVQLKTHLVARNEENTAINQSIQSHSCTVLGDTDMRCYLGSFSRVPLNLSLHMHVGLIMGRHSILRNLTKIDPQFLLYPHLDPPIIIPHSSPVTIYYDLYIPTSVNGENLDKGLSKADYKVKVGTGACEVQSLSANKLECMHPNDIPKKLTQADKCTEPDLRTIMVKVAGKEYFAGCGRYERKTDFGLILGLGIGIPVGVSILLVVIWFVLWKKKVTRAQMLQSLLPSKTQQKLENKPNPGAGNSNEELNILPYNNSIPSTTSLTSNHNSNTPHTKNNYQLNNYKRETRNYQSGYLEPRNFSTNYEGEISRPPSPIAPASFFKNFNIPRVLVQGLQRVDYNINLPLNDVISDERNTEKDNYMNTKEIKLEDTFNRNTQTKPFQFLSRAAKRLSYTRPFRDEPLY